MNKEPSIVIKHTQKWVCNVVIAHNICPFVKREFESESIHYEVIKDENLSEKLEQLVLSCEALDRDNSIETSLLIYPDSFENFDDYLDFADIANELLLKQGYEGVYQLASFHPKYCFAETELDDASNYTNRSPYPMLHILREASLERALSHFPNPESIPERNIQLTQELGSEFMSDLLNKCIK